MMIMVMVIVVDCGWVIVMWCFVKRNVGLVVKGLCFDFYGNFNRLMVVVLLKVIIIMLRFVWMNGSVFIFVIR